MNNRWLLLLLLLLVAGTLVGCRVEGPTVRVLARVNEIELTEPDLQREMTRTKAFYREQYDYNLDDPNNALILAQAEEDALNRIIDQELIRQVAEGLFPAPPAGQRPSPVIAVSDAEVQALAEQYEAQATSREELLTTNGFGSYDEFLDFVQGTLRVEKLAELYGQAEQVRASHILVATEAEARQVLARLQAGEDFAAIAQEVSLDPGSGRQGGDLGWFGRGMMVQPFEETAFSLAVNQPSQPVQTQFGYHIILVQEKAQRVDTQAFQAWFMQARAQAQVELYLFSMPTDLASGLNSRQIDAALQARFQEHGWALTSAAQVQVQQPGSQWSIADAGQRFIIRNEHRELNVYQVQGP